MFDALGATADGIHVLGALAASKIGNSKNVF